MEVRAGAELLFSDDAEGGHVGATNGQEVGMFEHIFTFAPAVGTRGTDDGVPVVASLPDGHEPDRQLVKASQTRRAPWSATWAPAAAAVAEAAPEAALRRAYLGWSYAAPDKDTKTALLRPWHEACVRLEAPFRGAPRSATLFALVDKIGVGKVTLAARSAAPPHALIGLKATSPSPGVADPGTHRFDLSRGAFRRPLEASEPFLLCVGTVERQPLPADGDSEPFIHVPVTAVATAGKAGSPGATFLMVLKDHGGSPAGSTSALDPWAGHTLALRAEFEEVALAASRGVVGRGFLSGNPR